jgi:hypothetical protein
MPTFSAKINFFLGLGERTAVDDVLIGSLLDGKDSKGLSRLLKANKMNEPISIFSTITPQ